MKLDLLQPAMSSILLCCLAAAGCSGPGRDGGSAEGELDASSRPEDPAERLRSRLRDKRKNILALMGDGGSEFSEASMRRRIEALQESFFDALARAKLCPSLDRGARTKMLAMSSGDFKRRRGEWCSRRTQVYEYKIRKYDAERKNLEARIAGERSHGSDKKKAPESRRRLGALEASLKRCEERCDKYSSKMQRYKTRYKKVGALSRMVLGKNSVPALYESYLADERSLREDAGGRGPSPEKTHAEGGAQQQDHGDCTICLCPLESARDTVGCASRPNFHTACLHEWKRRGNQTCPVCRGAFTEEQQRRLEEYEAKYVDHLHSLGNDLGLEDKYMRDGRPIDRGRAGDDFLKAMCTAIRRCVLNLRGHPGYAAIFSSPESSVYRRFYIPQNILEYFENAEVGRHDPRSRGFAKHRAILIRRMHDYLREERVYLDYYVAQLIRYFVFNIFYAVDSILEYSYTGLHELGDMAAKIQAIMRDPEAYPALYSSMPGDPGCSLGQTYRKLRQMVMGLDLPMVVYTERWLLKVSEAVFEPVQQTAGPRMRLREGR